MERGGDRRREEEEVPVNITSFIALFLPSVPFRTPHPQSQPPSDTIHELFLRAMTKEQTLTQKQPHKFNSSAETPAAHWRYCLVSR